MVWGSTVYGPRDFCWFASFQRPWIWKSALWNTGYLTVSLRLCVSRQPLNAWTNFVYVRCLRVYPSCQSQSQIYVTTDGQSVSLSCNKAFNWGLRPDFLLLSDNCGFVDVGCPLWRKNGSVVYNCCWSSPAQSFVSPSSPGLMTIFCSLKFETPSTWRARTPYLCPPGTGWPRSSLFVASYD
jgi:hypothetical protein